MNKFFRSPTVQLLENQDFGGDTARREYYTKPRMFSFDQMKDLFYIHLNRSEALQKVVRSEELLKEHALTLLKLREQEKANRQYFEGQLKEIAERIARGEENMETASAETAERFQECHGKLGHQQDQILKLQDLNKETRMTSDSLKTQLEKTSSRITQVKEQMSSHVT